MSDDGTRQSFSAIGFAFLVTEVEVGLAFAVSAAAQRDDAAKRARYIENARHALDTIERFRDRIQITAEQRSQLDEGFAALESKLRILEGVSD